MRSDKLYGTHPADQDLSWQARAECRFYDPELFFYPPRAGADVRRNVNAVAREICLRCPVIAECAEYGQSEPFGVWGGLGEDQRKLSNFSVRRFGVH